MDWQFQGPHLTPRLTILIELLGGLAALIRALTPLASVPMAAVLLVAMFSVPAVRLQFY
jgi:putative oxidoreductase